MRRAAAALATALTLSACGSSELTPAQLRSGATRICSAATVKLNRIALPEAPSGGIRFLTSGIAALAPEVSALRTLHDGQTFRDAITATSAELAALRFTLKGLRAGNDPLVAIKTLQQRLIPLEDRANTDWAMLAIPACADG